MTGRKRSDIAQYPKWPPCGHRDVNSQWAYCLCNFPPPITWSLCPACLSTNMSLNTVSSKPHNSSYQHLNSPVFFVSLALHLFVFPIVFFSHCSFPLFFSQFFPQCFAPILTPSHPSQHCPNPPIPIYPRACVVCFVYLPEDLSRPRKLLVAKITKVSVESCGKLSNRVEHPPKPPAAMRL